MNIPVKLGIEDAGVVYPVYPHFITGLDDVVILQDDIHMVCDTLVVVNKGKVSLLASSMKLKDCHSIACAEAVLNNRWPFIR